LAGLRIRQLSQHRIVLRGGHHFRADMRCNFSFQRRHLLFVIFAKLQTTEATISANDAPTDRIAHAINEHSQSRRPLPLLSQQDLELAASIEQSLPTMDASILNVSTHAACSKAL